MLISKFNLYNVEWLDLVFENRNKNYGAYELRQHYGGRMVKAMGITFFGVAVLCGAIILFRPAVSSERMIQVIVPVIPVLPPPVDPIKKVEPPAKVHTVKPTVPPPAATTIKVVPPVVVPDDKAEKPVVNTQITDAIGTENTKGTKGTPNVMPTDPPADGGGTAPDNSVHTINGLDFMPEPNGGMAGWSKFLSKNLRFPAEAQDAGVGGRVIVSFVIEKDGSLSNIVVDRKAGYGMDEEAARVLKLAKPWKPGMQNGQPVRVKYTLPINFQVPE